LVVSFAVLSLVGMWLSFLLLRDLSEAQPSSPLLEKRAQTS
jgi:hypothetical protein